VFNIGRPVAIGAGKRIRQGAICDGGICRSYGGGGGTGGSITSVMNIISITITTIVIVARSTTVVIRLVDS